MSNWREKILCLVRPLIIIPEIIRILNSQWCFINHRVSKFCNLQLTEQNYCDLIQGFFIGNVSRWNVSLDKYGFRNYIYLFCVWNFVDISVAWNSVNYGYRLRKVFIISFHLMRILRWCLSCSKLPSLSAEIR